MKQKISRPYEQLYISCIAYVLPVPEILKQRPPLPETVNLVWKYQEWWQSLHAIYGGPDESWQKTLRRYKRLAYGYMFSLLFTDRSLLDLTFIISSSFMSETPPYWSRALEDASWQKYCIKYATQLSLDEAKYRYLAVQRFLGLMLPSRPTLEEDYFEHYIWPQCEPNLSQESPQKTVKNTTPKPIRKKVKTLDNQQKPKMSTTDYDYAQIIAGLIQDGWLTKERVKRQSVRTLMDCVRFVDCIYRANQKRVFPEELIKRLWQEYKFVTKDKLNEFLDFGPSKWVSNAKEWLK